MFQEELAMDYFFSFRYITCASTIGLICILNFDRVISRVWNLNIGINLGFRYENWQISAIYRLFQLVISGISLPCLSYWVVPIIVVSYINVSVGGISNVGTNMYDGITMRHKYRYRGIFWMLVSYEAWTLICYTDRIQGHIIVYVCIYIHITSVVIRICSIKSKLEN